MPPRPFSEAGGVLLSGEPVGTPDVQRSAGQVWTDIAVGIGTTAAVQRVAFPFGFPAVPDESQGQYPCD